jgi:hypothetical protein
MPQNLSEQIRDCYVHAEDGSRQAKEQCDPQLRDNFLDCERRWLKLARGYELAERFEKETRSSATGSSSNSAELSA